MSVILTGKYSASPGVPDRGRVFLEAVTVDPATGAVSTVSRIVDAAARVVFSRTDPLVVELDAAGEFSIALPATDDATLSPSGFGWRLTPRLASGAGAALVFALNGPGPVDLVDVVAGSPAARWSWFDVTKDAADVVLAPVPGLPAGDVQAAVEGLQAAVVAAAGAAAGAVQGGDMPALVGAEVADPLSPAGVALLTTIAAEAPSAVGVQKRAPGGVVTTGNVVLIGDYAYAPAGIATAAVLGGAPLYENVIGGNEANVSTGGGGTKVSNLTGAPALTGNDGNWSFIHGGYDNVVNGYACSVMGYHCKQLAGGSHNTIAGGSYHIIGDFDYSTISGGTENLITGSNATIGGGRNHTAAASGTVAGGSVNTAAGSATVGGGFTNAASAAYATIAGGNASTASGNAASVGGGQANAASGQGATVPGGRDNAASAAYSLATGRGGKAALQSEHAHGNMFTAPGDAQGSILLLKRSSTDASVAPLSDTGGASAPTMPAMSTIAFTGLVAARRTDVEGDNAAFKIEGCYARGSASNTFVGTPTVTAIGATAGAATWVVAVTHGSGRLTINVTGETGKTIRWVCRLQTVQVA